MDFSPADPGLDWGKCIFCQKILSKMKTVCPGKSLRGDLGLGCGYITLSDAVQGFSAIGQLPSIFNVRLWDEGDGIAETCKRRNACWHLHCRQVLHATTSVRQRKRLGANPTLDDDSIESADTSNVSGCEIKFHV